MFGRAYLFKLLGKASKPFFGKGLSRYKSLVWLNTLLYNKLKPKPSELEYVYLEGMILWVKDSQYPQIAAMIYEVGHWEPFETKIIRNLIKPGMTVMDIGANIGYYTLLMSKWVGEMGYVISVEASPKIAKTLQRNVDENHLNNTLVVTAKVSDKGCTIDHLIGDGRVDFIKIDIDGGELQVLKGVKKTFDNNPQLQMMIEYAPMCLKVYNSNPKELLEKLTSRFEVSVLDGKNSKVVPVDQYELDDSTVINLLCTRKLRSYYNEKYYKDRAYAPDSRYPIIEEVASIINKYFSPPNVLDVGCAFGYLVLALRGLGIEAHGFDVSEYAISHASTLIKDFLKVGDADTEVFPYEDNSFSLVVSTECMEHLRNPSNAIKEMARVLKPSGHAFICTPNITIWRRLYGKLFGGSVLHPSELTKEEWIRKFNEFGFTYIGDPYTVMSRKDRRRFKKKLKGTIMPMPPALGIGKLLTKMGPLGKNLRAELNLLVWKSQNLAFRLEVK